MKIKFEKKEESKNNKLFIKLTYMSGDADAYEYEQYDLGIPFDKYKDNLNEIGKVVKDYQLIGKFTDINDKLNVSHPKYNKAKDIDDPYSYIKENYSEELADLYDNVPGDSTCDHQFKAHLSDIKLIGYDNNGVMYESYL